MRTPACSSASRSPRFNPARAFSSSRRDSSRVATRATLTRSKRAVYSSTAASPLARTPARMATTSSSTFWSKVVSNAVSALRRASKSGSVVARRAISGMRRCSLRELVEERLDGVAFELERRLIDDEAGADRPDLLDCLQTIGAQGIAAGNQIDDRVGETHERPDLHRTGGPDQVDVHATRRRVPARGPHVLGRHAQTRARAQRARMIEAFRNRDHHVARCDAEVERLVQPLASVLEENVLACDPQFRRAVLYVSGNVRSAP